MELPRGIRNNNPGNIRPGASWLGESGTDHGPDGGYVVFSKPEFGIRAIVRILITYDVRYHLHTPRSLITRWAPAGDGNPVESYVAFVCGQLGVTSDEDIVLDSSTVEPFVRAIIQFENGDPMHYGRPQWYTDTVLSAGIAMGFGGTPT